LASDFDKSTEAGAAGVSMMTTYNSTLASYSSTLYATGRNLTQSFVNGMQSVSVPTPSIGGYATGTENAMPGWAWVGEAGPELMRMKGGEQILNHEQSMNLMNQMQSAYQESEEQYQEYNASQQPIEMDYDSRGSYTDITVSPVIQISGVGSQSDMEAISDELMDRITETVMDAIEEAGVNAKRGKYS
jgi:SLT domain-containing protein